MLPEEILMDFIKAYQKQYGESLSKEEANKQIATFLRLYKLVVLDADSEEFPNQSLPTN